MGDEFLPKVKELLSSTKEKSLALEVETYLYRDEYVVNTHGGQGYTVNLPQMLCDFGEWTLFR